MAQQYVMAELKEAHTKTPEEILDKLETDPLRGLTDSEAENRIKTYGYNEIKGKKRKTPFQMFVEQFKDILILILIASTLLAVALGYYELIVEHKAFMEVFADPILIGVIVVLVGVSGFAQQYKAEKALEALRKLAAPKARVIRNGKEDIIPSKMVVPGDILKLETGDHIPADARTIETIELKTNEAVLTGESTPVNKELTLLKKEASISERANMIFTATHIVYGRGRAVVTTTGMNTEFGKIAEMVQTQEEEETPLQKKLDRFGKKLAKVVLVVCFVILVLEAVEILLMGHFNIDGFIGAIMSAVSLAISAVPEGLPAVVTITLALAAKEFVNRKAIVRRLSSAESLGSTTVICSDKTGTITKGEMTVRKIYVDGEVYEVTGVGYEPKGAFKLGENEVHPKGAFELILRIGTLCSNAQLNRNDEEGKWEIFGDPTEGGLIVSAVKAGLEKEQLKKVYPRVGEVPFTSERKRMTTIHRTQDGIFAYLKGAPEILLERCSQILENGEERSLTKSMRERILETNEKLAGDALRVLSMAYKRLPTTLKEYNEKTVENGLVFVGLQGMIDPARPEAISANKLCQDAGIKTVMITGDHKLTATAIAKEVGIFKEGDIVLTGVELDKLSDEEFERIVEKVTVYARVSPEHKLRIVNALKKKGHIASMTGDGVNDAPAVKAADVGVAMGITGTDVTKESSDLILTDDNFSTIVNAVEMGRAVYDNIRKFIRFLIACNFDELFVIGTFAILGGIFGEKLFPLPLTPAMILWINLVTDGFPAVALAFDPPEPGIMGRLPRDPKESVLHGQHRFIFVSFLLQSLGTILVFSIFYYIIPPFPWSLAPEDEAARLLTYSYASTAAFIQAAMFEMFVVWNCRSEKNSVFRMGLNALKNKWFIIAEIFGITLTLGICYIPITQAFFHITPLDLIELLVIFVVAASGLLVWPEWFMDKDIPYMGTFQRFFSKIPIPKISLPKLSKLRLSKPRVPEKEETLNWEE